MLAHTPTAVPPPAMWIRSMNAMFYSAKQPRATLPSPRTSSRATAFAHNQRSCVRLECPARLNIAKHRTTNYHSFLQSHPQRQSTLQCALQYQNIHLDFIHGFERPYTKQQQRDEGSNSPQPVGCNVGARNLHEVSLLQQDSMKMADRFAFDYFTHGNDCTALIRHEMHIA